MRVSALRPFPSRRGWPRSNQESRSPRGCSIASPSGECPRRPRGPRAEVPPAFVYKSHLPCIITPTPPARRPSCPTRRRCATRYPVCHRERFGMRGVCVQSMHQRWTLQNDPNPRVAMTVDSSLVTLGQAKPPLQIEIVPDGLKLARADEQAGEKAHHHLDQLLVNRVRRTREAIDQFLGLLLAIRAGPPFGFEGRGHFLDVLRRSLGSSLVRPELRLGLGRCRRPGGRVVVPRIPLFLVQVPLDRRADLIQRIRHPHAGGGGAVLPDRR
jgi:hypothetical protein